MPLIQNGQSKLITDYRMTQICLKHPIGYYRSLIISPLSPKIVKNAFMNPILA